MRTCLILSSLLLCAALTACGGNDCTESNAAGTSSVQLSGNKFVPACVKVSPGGTLTFTNMDSTPHQVTSSGVDSGPIAAGASYQRTFATAGTVDLRCPLHGEGATVVVH